MAGFDFSSYTVLVCDSDPAVMVTAKEAFDGAGVKKVIAIPSPERALEILAETKPDLILVSMMFSHINGIQVVQKIRALNDEAYKTTPILLTLEKVSQGLLREACRAGIEGAMRKPITADKLLRFARSVILKPRRFICVRNYFGPERRMRSDPHFEGDERRHEPSDIPSGSSSSSVRAGVVLSGAKPKSKPEGVTLDLSANKNQKTAETVMDFSSGERSKDSGQSFDFTSHDRPLESAFETDFTSQEKQTQHPTEVPTSETKVDPEPEAVISEEQPEHPLAAQTQEPIEVTGPDSDIFEEVIDLEECLDLHKQWINSGGSTGQRAHRPNSDFRNTELVEVDFTQAQLPQSNFEQVDCTGAVFRKADLSGSTFKDAVMSSTDLRVSLLRKADLRSARLDKANLLGADISGANLEGATLRGVNFSGAHMSRTNLRGVDLSSAQGLIPEQIQRAITDSKTRLPLNLRSSG